MGRYDCTGGRFYNYPVERNGGPDNIIYSMLFHEGLLYVSARNGIWTLDPETDRFSRLLSYEGKPKGSTKFRNVNNDGSDSAHLENPMLVRPVMAF